MSTTINQSDFDATYSPEDNKLRLYATYRLDPEEYERVKAAGFRWAPKQELFVAPAWTPAREDLCLEFAGSIEPEQSTLAERAQIKADRLDGYAQNRLKDSDSYHRAADAISQRFAAGQPILIGHHSQRKAEKDAERMRNAMDKAVKATQTANYWNCRAEGVERHANRKNRDDVRARRIKKLLAEMRDIQRNINRAYKFRALWQKILNLSGSDNFAGIVEQYAGHSEAAPWQVMYKGEKVSVWSALDKGTMTPLEAAEICLRHHDWLLNNPHYMRWLQHLLNRLAYERAELGETPRFEGELTPVILQAFAREQGADKPKAVKRAIPGDAYTFTLSSVVPFPLHMDPGSDMCSGGNMELLESEWRDLMQQCGHVVSTKERRPGAKQTCPLINPTPETAEALQAIWNEDASKRKHCQSLSAVREVSQAYYSANSKGDYAHFHTITLDQYGRKMWNKHQDEKAGRVPTCRVRTCGGSGLYSPDCVIVIEDKPQKALPAFEDKPEQAAA